MVKGKVNKSAHLSTPHHISEKGRKEIVESLNPLVADAFALYIKTKSFHWHVFGPHFRDYHLLFDEHAEQIFATTDVLAERVRKLGGTTIRSVGHIVELTAIKDEDRFPDPIGMIRELLADNRGVAQRMLKAHKICDDHEDVATASILEVMLDETERRIWFLFEIAESDKSR